MKPLYKIFAIGFLALSFPLLSSCGDDEPNEPANSQSPIDGSWNDEPNEPENSQSPIEGYWSATVYTLDSGSYYMLSFKNGYCQFYECHNGKNLRSNSKFEYDLNSSILNLTESDGERKGKYNLQFVNSETLVLQLPSYGEITLSKVDKWDIAPIDISYWEVDNDAVYGIFRKYLTTPTDTEGFYLGKDGTGTVIYKKEGESTKTSRKIKWTFHPLYGEGNGVLWFQFSDDPTSDLIKLEISGFERSEKDIFTIEGVSFQFFFID